MMRGRARALTALALSLAIYAVPIVSAHWLGFFGPTLVAELGSDRPANWIAADVALALGAQSRPRCGLAWLALGWGRLAGIIALILAVGARGVRGERRLHGHHSGDVPDRGRHHARHRRSAGGLRAAAGLAGAGAGRASRAASTRAAKRWSAPATADTASCACPQCVVEPVAIPRLPIAPAIQQVAEDGGVMYMAYERGVPGQTFWLLRRGATQPVPIVPPAGVSTSYPFPLLSNDARWVAWTMRPPDGPVTIQLTPVDGGEPRVIAHDLLQRATLTPVELDMTGGTLTINRDLKTFVALGLDGELLWGPLTVPDVAVQPQTFRYLDGQWLAWDAYVEGRAKRVSLVNACRERAATPCRWDAASRPPRCRRRDGSSPSARRPS